jgi:hypothetical protein
MNIDFAKLMERIAAAAQQSGTCDCEACRQQKAMSDEISAKLDHRACTIMLDGAELAKLLHLLEQHMPTSSMYPRMLDALIYTAKQSGLSDSTMFALRRGVASKRHSFEMRKLAEEEQAAKTQANASEASAVRTAVEPPTELAKAYDLGRQTYLEGKPGVVVASTRDELRAFERGYADAKSEGAARNMAGAIEKFAKV